MTASFLSLRFSRRLALIATVGLLAGCLNGAPHRPPRRPCQAPSPKQRVPHRAALRELVYSAVTDAKVAAGN